MPDSSRRAGGDPSAAEPTTSTPTTVHGTRLSAVKRRKPASVPPVETGTSTASAAGSCAHVSGAVPSRWARGLASLRY